MFRVLICFKRWIMSAYLYAYCIQLKWGCQELLHWSYSRLCQTAIFDCQIPQFSLRQPQANKLSWLFAIFDCQIRQLILRQSQTSNLSLLLAIFDCQIRQFSFSSKLFWLFAIFDCQIRQFNLHQSLEAISLGFMPHLNLRFGSSVGSYLKQQSLLAFETWILRYGSSDCNNLHLQPPAQLDCFGGFRCMWLITLLLSSMERNFPPFPSIWRNFSSHKAFM